MSDLKSISISPYEDRFMVLHTQPYDTILETQHLPEVLSRLSAIYELETEKNLEINVLERTEAKMKDGTIRQVVFNQTGVYKIILSLSMNNIDISPSSEPSPDATIKQKPYANQNQECFELHLQHDNNQEHVAGPSRTRKIHHRSSKIDVFAGYKELISGTFTSCGGEVSSRGIRIKIPENAIEKNIQSITILVNEAQHHKTLRTNSEIALSDLVVISSRTQRFKYPIEIIVPLTRKPQNYKDIVKYARWTNTLPNEEPAWTDMKLAKGKPGLNAVVFEYNCARFQTVSCGMVYLAAKCNDIDDLEVTSSEGRHLDEDGRERKGGGKGKRLSPYDTEESYFKRSGKKKKGILKTIRSSFRHAFHKKKKVNKKDNSCDNDSDYTYESFSEYTDSETTGSHLYNTDRTEETESVGGHCESEPRKPPRPPPPKPPVSRPSPPSEPVVVEETGQNSLAATAPTVIRAKATPNRAQGTRKPSPKSSPPRPPPPTPPSIRKKPPPSRPPPPFPSMANQSTPPPSTSANESPDSSLSSPLGPHFDASSFSPPPPPPPPPPPLPSVK